MVRTLYGLEPQGGDISQVCALRFLVHRTLVQTWVLGSCGVDGIYMYHRQQSEEDLRLGLDQFTATAIPTCAIQV